MNFLELQTKFAKKHLDTRTTWIAWWDDNKKALNDWYNEVYLKAIQDRSVQQSIKTVKTLVTLTDSVWTLPVDYLQPVKVYLKSAWRYSEIDPIEDEYRFQRVWWVNKIIFEETPNFPVYIEYIQKLTDMVDDLDEPVLPAEFDRNIINYSLVEYHKNQRDWGEVSNELQYAEWKMQETIDNFWLE